MTMQQLLWQGVQELNKAGVPDPQLDARYLLLEVFHLNLASFLALKARELGRMRRQRENAGEFMRLIEARAGRTPLQHLTGTQEFMGFEFLVNEHVLIPRQDTETLVELVLEEQKDREKRVLDMCTGSGCIAISLALMGRYRHVAALDVSAEALKVAAGNRDRLLGGYEGGFELFESNMFSALGTDRTFDVIVSNPPYIPSRVIEGLAPEVRDHEPRIALDGSEDGLTFYRILAEEARNHLAEGGSIYMEIGYDQSEAVEGLFRSGGYRDVRTFQDLAGQDRVVRARR
ncbi:MAG: peptide chain release factor N(5)-glutamine methyltransferase [Enterocloster sp.]